MGHDFDLLTGRGEGLIFILRGWHLILFWDGGVKHYLVLSIGEEFCLEV